MSVSGRKGRHAGINPAMHPNEAPRLGRPALLRHVLPVGILRKGADDEDSRPRVPPSQAGAKRVFLNCHYCGYAPAAVPPGGVCPKCGGHSWERFALSTRLLPHPSR